MGSIGFMFPRLLEISRPDLLRNPNACLSFFEQNEVLDTNIHKQIGTMTLTQIKDICSSASMSLPTPVLAVKLLTPDATLPTRGSAKAAGLDLFASQDALLAWGERKLISTGLCVKICENHYGRVAPRSGNAVKHGLTIGAGVIDEVRAIYAVFYHLKLFFTRPLPTA